MRGTGFAREGGHFFARGVAQTILSRGLVVALVGGMAQPSRGMACASAWRSAAMRRWSRAPRCSTQWHPQVWRLRSRFLNEESPCNGALIPTHLPAS